MGARRTRCIWWVPWEVSHTAVERYVQLATHVSPVRAVEVHERQYICKKTEENVPISNEQKVAETPKREV